MIDLCWVCKTNGANRMKWIYHGPILSSLLISVCMSACTYVCAFMHAQHGLCWACTFMLPPCNTFIVPASRGLSFVQLTVLVWLRYMYARGCAAASSRTTAVCTLKAMRHQVRATLYFALFFGVFYMFWLMHYLIQLDQAPVLQLRCLVSPLDVNKKKISTTKELTGGGDGTTSTSFC